MEYPALWSPRRRTPFQMLQEWQNLLESDLTEGNGQLAMPINVEEQDDKYLVEAEVPGIRREDLEVSLEGNLLTLRVERDTGEREERGKRFIRRERRYGISERVIHLPLSTSEEDVMAKLEDGILTIEIPKRPEKRSKRIEIS